MTCMHYCVVVTSGFDITLSIVTINGRSRTVSELNLSFDRRQGAWSATVDRDILLLDPRQIVLDRFMSRKLFLELILVQVGLEAEYFAGNLLVLPFNPLKLLLALIEVQAFRSELDLLDRVTLA